MKCGLGGRTRNFDVSGRDQDGLEQGLKGVGLRQRFQAQLYGMGMIRPQNGISEVVEFAFKLNGASGEPMAGVVSDS